MALIWHCAIYVAPGVIVIWSLKHAVLRTVVPVVFVVAFYKFGASANVIISDIFVSTF
jgi:hypothetical protein